MLRIGHIVEWTSQSSGYTKTKSGEVVAIIPAGENAQENVWTIFKKEWY